MFMNVVRFFRDVFVTVLVVCFVVVFLILVCFIPTTDEDRGGRKITYGD